MIVRSLLEVVGTDRDVAWGHGQSRRFLLARDGFGFSLSDTTVDPGTETVLAYHHHVEACYCIEGLGEVEDAAGHVHRLESGVLYAVDRGETHRVRARTRLRLVCIFSPPLEGEENHRRSQDAASSSY